MRNYTNTDPLSYERISCGDPIEPFMVRLFARWRGLEGELIENAHPDLQRQYTGHEAAYDQVLEQWTTPEFADSIVKACDYYCESTDNFGRISPYDVFPVEFVAIDRIRREQGQVVPEINHPVLQNPMMDVPRQMPKSEHDDLLECVVQRCKQIEPDLDLS